MGKPYQLDGLSSPSGERFVLVRSEGTEVCLSLAALMLDEKAAKYQLARNGIVLVGAAEWRKLLAVRVNQPVKLRCHCLHAHTAANQFASEGSP